MKKTLVIGVTGGIASGKTSVVKGLARLGARVIDADRLAREVVRPGSPALKRIELEFGKSVLLPGGALDRRRLAAIVFSSPARRKALERITHPAIIKEIGRGMKALSGKAGLVAVDAPLLFEAGIEDMFDVTVAVWCPPEMQVTRLVKRDGIGRKDARARIRSQMPLKSKLKLADLVLDNSSGRAGLSPKIRRLLTNSCDLL